MHWLPMAEEAAAMQHQNPTPTAQTVWNSAAFLATTIGHEQVSQMGCHSVLLIHQIQPGC